MSKLMCSLMAILMVLQLHGQEAIILNETNISVPISYPLNEPHLIIDPNDSQHLIAGAILTREWIEGSRPDSYMLILQSWDGGQTWEEKHLNEDIDFGADPWLAMNNDGVLIVTSLGSEVGRDKVDLIAHISPDGGRTWNKNIVNLGPGHDRQSVVVDPVSQDFVIVSGKGNYNEDGHYVFGIMITRLYKDGAFRESNWHGLSNIDKNNGPPIISPDQELIIPYVDYLINNKRLETRRNWIVKSRDLGYTLSDPILLSEGGTFPKVMLDSTADQPVFIHMNSEGKRREYLGYTIQRSTDGGYNWGEKVDVTQYDGEHPYIRMACWDISESGIIGVFWYDRRLDPETDATDIYFSFSVDSGMYFTSPQRLTTSSSASNAEINGMTDRRWPVGGDYFGVAATGADGFHVIWVDYRNGPPQLFHSLVRIRR